VRKLKELIPRQQFDIPIQAAIGSKIISRETLSLAKRTLQPNVTGVIFRFVKESFLEKPKESKNECDQVGKRRNPQESIYGGS